MKTVGIIQARMGSSRLPGKVLMDLGGGPALALMLTRAARAQTLDAIGVATSMLPQDDPIAALCGSLGVPVFRGSESDVLDRYAGAAAAFGADVIVRLTGDCPLICPEITDSVVRAFQEGAPRVEYATNCLRRTQPRGLDTEVLSRATLDEVAREATEPADREHVTYFVWRQPDRFRHLSVERADDRAALRWTLDTPEDYALLKTVVDALGDRAPSAGYDELLDLFDRHPAWAAINAAVEQRRP
jgi:spore coat polysaccharide biosynthesis protein SpsF